MLTSIAPSCMADVCILDETVSDYIDIANLYMQKHDYSKALEYINMVESYDKYNPKIKYQKIYILKSLNEMERAKDTLDKLVQLNQDYACSDLAKSFYSKDENKFCYGFNEE